MVANQERRTRPEQYTLPEIMRREAHARDRLVFEEKLLDGSIIRERDVGAFTDSRGIQDDTAVDNYYRLYERFRNQVFETDAAEISIKDLLFVDGEDMNEQFPEEWGLRFFEHWVGKLPKDVVVFKRLPNYFQVICESSEDYIRLMEALYPEKDNTDVRGRMHNRRLTNLAGVVGEINLMAINGKENTITTKYVILHEKQHAMNDLELDSFADIETRAFQGKKLYVDPENRGEVIKQFVILKDELLANYKQRKPAENIKNDLLDYELFDELEDLSGQIFVKTIGLFDNIMDEFAALQPSLQTEKDYGLLVYQLTDIPLLDFPKYLRAYRSYLEQDIAQSVAAK